MVGLLTLGLLLVVAVFNSDGASIGPGFGAAPRGFGSAGDPVITSRQRLLPLSLDNRDSSLPTQQAGAPGAAIGGSPPVQPVARPQPSRSFFPRYRYAYPQQYYYNPYSYWMYSMMDDFFD